jgi:hypothetical protein
MALEKGGVEANSITEYSRQMTADNVQGRE